MVASVVAEQLPVMEPPDLGDTKAEMLAMFKHGLPAEGLSYVALIGGLIAEHDLDRADRGLPRARAAAAPGHGAERDRTRSGARRHPAEPHPLTGIDLLVGQFLALRVRRPRRRARVARAGVRVLVDDRQEPTREQHMKIAFSIDIARPVDEVFAYVTEPANLPSGSPPRSRSGWRPDGPMGVGTRMTEVRRGPFGRRIESLVEVSEYERDRRFSLRIVDGPLPVDGAHTFEVTPGGTRIDFVAEGSSPWPPAGPAAPSPRARAPVPLLLRAAEAGARGAPRQRRLTVTCPEVNSEVVEVVVRGELHGVVPGRLGTR